jgi:hypothetical protein
VSIRKFVLQGHPWTTWSPSATLTARAARFLEAAVDSGLNVLVAGGTRAGKTTPLGRLGFGALAGSSAPRTDAEPAGGLVGGVEPGIGGDHLVAPGPVISA